MYGKPLDPNKTSFAIYINDDDEIEIALEDNEDYDNDDIRDVDDPIFDMFFDNICECLFISNYFTNIEEAKTWLLSIGMTENSDLEGSVGG